ILGFRQRRHLGDLPRLRRLPAAHGHPDGLPDRPARGAAADPGWDRRDRPRADRLPDRLRRPRGADGRRRARLPDHPLLATARPRRRRLRDVAPGHAEWPGVHRVRTGDRQAVRLGARQPSGGRAVAKWLWEKLPAMRAPRVALITLAILLVSAPAALACDAGSFDPADQPPFGGQTTTLSRPLAPGARVPGFRLTA